MVYNYVPNWLHYEKFDFVMVLIFFFPFDFNIHPGMRWLIIVPIAQRKYRWDAYGHVSLC